MSEREMISRSHPENEAIRRETVKWQQAANKSLSELQRENDALRAEIVKLRRAMLDIYEEYVSSIGEGYFIETLLEDDLSHTINRMMRIAAKHKQPHIGSTLGDISVANPFND